jgi:hypothetical protein
MFEIRRLVIIALAVALCALPAAAIAERTVTGADADGLITVRLSLPDGSISGVTEEIPIGFEFSGSEHPKEQTLAEGMKVHFAVIGEAEIVYYVKGTGKPEITGKWLDLTSDGNETAVEDRRMPGFGLLAGMIALVIGTFTWGRSQ